MKKMNQILSLLLTVCMVLTMLPVNAFAVVQEVNSIGVVSESAEMNGSALKEKLEAIKENAPGLAEEPDVTVSEQSMDVSITEIARPDIDLKNQAAETVKLNVPNGDEMVRVIVVVEGKSLLEQGYSTAQIADPGFGLKLATNVLVNKQEKILKKIGDVVSAMSVDAVVDAKYNYSVALNGFAVEVPYGALEAIKAIDGVKTAFVAPEYSLPEDAAGSASMSPNMVTTSNTFGSAQTWDELEYTGAGMRIAIIDTGLDTDHPSFVDAPVLTDSSLTASEIDSVLKDLHAYNGQNGNIEAEDLYISEKVPFGYNYVDETLDVTHDNDVQGDHGTHVAGISAANAIDATDVVGVAPDAQLLVMKVFGVDGGAYFDDIMAALEDALRLNADAINMSLGSPAGFTTAEADEAVDAVYESLYESDVIVSISAGNSYSAAYYNVLGTDVNFAWDPDNGIVSSPGTYAGATMVASVENDMYPTNYLMLGDMNIVYSDSRGDFAAMMAAEEATEWEYVMVPGLGDVTDFELVDVAGKIAVVQRGTLSFVEKQTNAFNFGAVACIVYDNVEGDLINMQDAELLPNVFVSLESGLALAAATIDGVGKLTVMPAAEMILVDSTIAGQMSDFSSWGVTPDLQLAPDVSAPGGNIYSCYTDGQYGLMSGTSMSAPHIAGMSALVLQYLEDQYDLTDAQIHTVAEALVMSTAVPVLEETGLEYSPRKQGSGEANVYSAVTSPAYLTVHGSTPSVSFGDDDAKKGNYTFTFELNNLSDEAQTYVLDSSVLTDQVVEAYGFYFMGETSCALDAAVKYSYFEDYNAFLKCDVNGDKSFDEGDIQYVLDVLTGVESNSIADLDGNGTWDTEDAQWLLDLLEALPVENASNIVTVPAGETVIVTVNIALSEEDKAYMDAYYANGIYVDGFIRCLAVDENGVDLSLPFMGFYGDWSAADVFDLAWHYDDENALYNRYPNTVLTDAYYLGLNPYIDEAYDGCHNVLSPNGDGYQDNLSDIYLGLMRNAKALTFTWTDAEGNEIYKTTADYARKSYYAPAYGMIYPFVYTEYLNLGVNEDETAYIPDMPDFTGMADGTVVTLQIDAYLDDGDDVVDQSLAPITMVMDSTAPEIRSVELIQDPINNDRKLVLTASDNFDIAAIIPITAAGEAFEYYPAQIEEGSDSVTIELDVSDFDSTFVLAVCDYGANETYYEISFKTDEGLNEDRFYAYRRYAAVTEYSSYYDQDVTYVTDAFNGWVSYEAPETMLTHTYMYDGEIAVSAAEYIDGYVFGVDVDGQIFAMKSGDWTRIPLGTMPQGQDADYNYVAYPALDMAYDYAEDVLYILTDELDVGAGGHLLTLDYLTGEVTDLAVVRTSADSQPLTLACDNFGTLYTIDYMTGDLYTIDPEKIVVEEPANWWEDPVSAIQADYVASTGYVPSYTQTMAVDHETNTLYWLAYQGSTSIDGSQMFQVNTKTGELTSVGAVEYNSEMSGLFRPFSTKKDLIPVADLSGIVLDSDTKIFNVGSSAELNALPVPYNAELGELTWTSSDETVATVSEGEITAVSEGTAVITVTCGEFSAECFVTVVNLTSELTLFDYGNDFMWESFSAVDPGSAEPLADAMIPAYNGITAAAYFNGYVYAADEAGGFFRLDAETMQGTQIGSTGSMLLGMAFNYADGYMYGIENYSAGMWESYFYLVRVNLNTGKLERVAQLDSTYSFMVNLAVDYEGNFYSIGANNDTYGVELVRYSVSDDVMEITGTWSLDAYPVYNYSSVTYSAQDNGLFYCDDMGQLFWIDMDSLEGDELKVVNVGFVGENTGYAMNMGMFTVPAEVPELPTVEITNVSVPAEYTLLAGGSVSSGITVEPWNAYPAVTYTVENPEIAAVDADGAITGISAGETVLNVVVDGWATEYNLPIYVKESAGYLHGFLLTDFLYASGYTIKFADTDPSNDYDVTSDVDFTTSFMMFAGAYYDGIIYGYGQDQTGEYDYKNYFVTIDTDTYEISMGEKINYTLRDMAFDYTSGNLYAMASGGQYKGAVAQVDMQTGAVSVIADTGIVMLAMTIDAQGQMYAIGEDANLYKVDKNTGDAELIGNTGVKGGELFQSMHYDMNTGNTYWAQAASDQTSSLRLVNLATGASTNLGTVCPSGAEITCLYTVPVNEPTVPDESTFQVTGVQLPKTNTVVAGETLQLNATVLTSVELKPAASTMSVASTSASDVIVTWTSEDDSIATVDENGLVTGVAAGVVGITASVGDKSATCVVTVTASERLFYAYDKTNTQWISFSAKDPATILNVWDDAEGDAALYASAYTGETIYAYDVDGKFYQINPDDFSRTEISEGFYGQPYTLMVEGYDYWSGESYTYEVECELSVVDLSYDNGKLYGAFTAKNEDEWVESYLICEIDVTNGSFVEIFQTSEVRPGNLLVEDGRAFFVDTYTSGLLTYVDLYVEEPAYTQQALVQGYWGYPDASSALIKDELTGNVYALRDFTETSGTYDEDWNFIPYDGVTGDATLVTLNLADADIQELGTIGTGLLIRGMFIK